MEPGSSHSGCDLALAYGGYLRSRQTSATGQEQNSDWPTPASALGCGFNRLLTQPARKNDHFQPMRKLKTPRVHFCSAYFAVLLEP